MAKAIGRGATRSVSASVRHEVRALAAVRLWVCRSGPQTKRSRMLIRCRQVAVLPGGCCLLLLLRWPASCCSFCSVLWTRQCRWRKISRLCCEMTPQQPRCWVKLFFPSRQRSRVQDREPRTRAAVADQMALVASGLSAENLELFGHHRQNGRSDQTSVPPVSPRCGHLAFISTPIDRCSASLPTSCDALSSMAGYPSSSAGKHPDAAIVLIGDLARRSDDYHPGAHPAVFVSSLAILPGL